MAAQAIRVEALPTEVEGARSVGWWGMVLLITTEATLFACLLFSYFYLRVSSSQWPLGGIKRPELLLPGIMTAVLLASSAPMAWAERGIRRGRRGQLLAGLALSFLLGAAFL